jgi:hypothetical protein
MSFTINDGATVPVAHVFTQEQAQQGRNIPAIFVDRSPALGPKSFLKLENLARFGQNSGADTTQLHLFANHYTDPGTGVLTPTGSYNGWCNMNTTGTASVEAVRKLFGMILVNALANTVIRDATFQVKPLVG